MSTQIADLATGRIDIPPLGLKLTLEPADGRPGVFDLVGKVIHSVLDLPAPGGHRLVEIEPDTVELPG